MNKEGPSRLIDARIRELGDWRGRLLGLLLSAAAALNRSKARR